LPVSFGSLQRDIFAAPSYVKRINKGKLIPYGVLGTGEPDFSRVYMDAAFTFQYNPEILEFKKEVSFVEHSFPGSAKPVLQYVGGKSTTFSLKLLFDVSSTSPVIGEIGRAIVLIPPELLNMISNIDHISNRLFGNLPIDWSKEMLSHFSIPEFSKASVEPVISLLKVFLPRENEDSGVSLPPRVLIFVWGSQLTMDCVITSMKTRYTLFDEGLTPIRAEVDLELKEYGVSSI